MASPAASSVLLLLLTAFAACTNAANFTITNQCNFTVWPAAIPVGGGVQLDPADQPWTINVPAGTSGRVWGRTRCNFSAGGCQTGDCAGVLNCTIPGQPPATLAEFTIGDQQDIYDISVIEGYNLAMDFSCETGDALSCEDPRCPDAQPSCDPKNHTCSGNNNYQVTFCP